MRHNVLSAEFLHVSNTFKKGLTELHAFEHHMLMQGDAAITARGAANTEIGGFLDEGLKQQTIFDLEAFERVSERELPEAEREEFMTVQHQANRWTYLGSGMTHPKFLATLEKLSPAQRKRIEEVAPVFC